MPGPDRAQATAGVGGRLRQLRLDRRMTAKEVATDLGWSSSKLSRIENAASGVKLADLNRLLERYGADEGTRESMRRLLDRATTPDPVEPPALPFAYSRYIELERQAARILLYGAAVVPGLLQIPAYANAMVHATPEPELEQADERLEARLLRQAVFARAVPIDVVIDEAVLRRAIGGSEVFDQQMRQLLVYRSRPATEIRVLPFAVGAHPALNGPFAILEFADEREPTTVFCDGLTGGVLRTDPDDVDRYHKCFSSLKSLALSLDESAEAISSAL